jgi:hypothetical protein
MDRMDSLAAREVRVQFEALLVAPLLEPLVDGMDSAGSYEADLFAREIAERLGPAR